MKRILFTLMLLVAWIGISTSMAQSQAASEELFFEDFDNSANFPDGAVQPAGWLSTGNSAMQRWESSAVGATAKSGSYVYGTLTHYAPLEDYVYLPKVSLKGGVEATLSFSVITPQMNPGPAAKSYNFTITAGKEQTQEAQTISVGTLEQLKAANAWVDERFTFTPEEDGEYSICLKITTPVASVSFIFLDDVCVEGAAATGGEQPQPAANEIASLRALYTEGINDGTLLKYTGSAIVTHMDNDGSAIAQDNEGGVLLHFGFSSEMKCGTQFTNLEGVLSHSNGLPVLEVAAQTDYEVTGEEGVPMITEVTSNQLTATPDVYSLRLVTVDGAKITDVEDGDVFEAGQSYTVNFPESDNAPAMELLASEGTDLVDTAIPTDVITLKGIITSADGLTIMPRSLADIDERVASVEHDVEPLPYAQSFDNENQDYDGTTVLPRGWTSTGTIPFVTANTDDLPALTGVYYAITPESTISRDEVLYTPFFEMEAGKTYHVSFYLYMPGRVVTGPLRATNLTLTANSEQESTAQVATLLEVKDTSYPAWQHLTADYKPEANGQYCFAFNLASASEEYANMCGNVAIEDLLVIADGQSQRPTADFTISSWFDIMDSGCLAFDGEPVKVFNLSRYATEYKWTVTNLADNTEVMTSTDANPEIIFPCDGRYQIALKATSAGGSRTAYKEIDVKVKAHAYEDQVGVMNYNPADDVVLGSPTTVPKFDTDPLYDYITGFNHYYHSFAQRYELPEGETMTISTISTWLVAYSRYMSATAEERNHPFSLSFYGETNGRPDEQKCFGTVNTDVVSAFGQIGIGNENSKSWGFDLKALGAEPIMVNGPFYIALNFSTEMPMESPVAELSRSYVALGAIKHKSNVTTLYVKPEHLMDNSTVPEGSTWARLDELDRNLAGHGVYMVLWASRNDIADKLVALNTEGRAVFAVRLDADRLTISGTEAGDKVRLYGLDGVLKLAANGQKGSTQVNVSTLPAGSYVVVTPQGTAKVVVR